MIKLKLAYVYHPSSVSDKYHNQLIHYLSRFYDVTPFTNHESEIRKFESNFKDFERILYHLENSRNHRYIVNLVEKIPGVLLLHDFYLYNLFTPPYTEKIEMEEGLKGLIKLNYEGEEKTLKSLPLNMRIINNAIGVIYHSEEFLSLFEKFYLPCTENLHFIPLDTQNLDEQLHFTLEKIYEQDRTIQMLKAISELPIQSNKIEKTAFILARNRKKTLSKRVILVDCSVLVRHDAKTGIQRVVKSQLSWLTKLAPENTFIEPVYLACKKEYCGLMNAKKWGMQFFQLNFKEAEDELIFPEHNHLYYSPEVNYEGVISAYEAGFYHYLKLKGLKLAFFVHDLLPIELPNCFVPPLPKLHEKWCEIILKVSDLLICNSKATADAIKKFAEERGLLRKNIKIHWLHLGCDIALESHSQALTKQDQQTLKEVSSRPYFLKVATIEPRKGHSQLLKAFEILWQKGFDYNLIFVGKQGWLVEELIEYIEKHPEKNRRFFWLCHVSDSLLSHLYKNAIATIMSSESEGFGLPIVESAYYSTPIIARDIEVFKEIALDGAYYFSNTKNPEDLANDLINWISLYNENLHPKPNSIKWMTWQQHTEKLLNLLLH